MGRKLALLGLAGSLTAVLAVGAAAATHAQFVAKANALCVQANAKGKALKSPSTAAQAVTYMTKTIAIVSQLRTGTLALPAPSADRSDIVKGMNQIAREIADFRQARTAAQHDDITAYQAALSKATTANHAATVYAKKLGLGKACTG